MIGASVIGGEFRIEQGVLDKENVNDISPVYSLGRTCLHSILNSLADKTDELICPDYICHSVTEVPDRMGIKVSHYHITSDFMPEIESVESVIADEQDKKAILLVSYFGMINLDSVISFLRDKYPKLTIIVDDVQNYFGFGNHIDYDYCFSSYRKWSCVPDGADVIEKNKSGSLTRFFKEAKYAQFKVAGNLLKNYSNVLDDEVALELLTKGEELMDKEYDFMCSEISSKLINKIDFDEIAKKRKSNAAFLHKHLISLKIDHLYSEEGVPLFVPISIHERDNVRKRFFDNGMFMPIHWPVIDSKLQSENNLYKTELSLICDQRYDETDMERIIKVLKDAI